MQSLEDLGLIASIGEIPWVDSHQLGILPMLNMNTPVFDASAQVFYQGFDRFLQVWAQVKTSEKLRLSPNSLFSSSNLAKNYTLAAYRSLAEQYTNSCKERLLYLEGLVSKNEEISK